MKYINLETSLLNDTRKFHEDVKKLAPQNSTYIGKDNGKVVDYIYVDGKRVRSNTNNLYNSILQRIEGSSGKNMTIKTYVDTSQVPYYDRAVLSPTLLVAGHYGRVDYGNKRYVGSVEFTKENRNHLYYLEGQESLRNFINKWNGLVVEIEDSLEDFK